ncbi:SDR family oxidoreductase [Rhizorhabdus dicambivorans]|uniref:3-oxoacyl-ACP reductase n=1 Tax=Rhizorhabdus dicambivorans TaxID=1850238 RepID=A0A2A4FUB7_9SPHN|nr:SDR family oxidoreductase [Rhizorhabdus dicambivorans]ATE64737.1 3-oxoacyl-ACP reductase [Rhizorhabdus dicambivorans]PCE41320.1 3-oxoacyl-ACP reductase [Rhizorhabdus dicambivorans]
MDLQLLGKTAVVNGASQGIGFAIARRLAAEGADLLISARKEAALISAAEQISMETGRKVRAVVGDLRMADGCDTILAAVHECGGADILVNNGGAPPLGAALDFDDLRWSRAFEQNLLSVVRMIRGVVPAMAARGGGSIVNITALCTLQPMPNFGLSVSTWAGVLGIAKTLSLELGPKNIRVNTLCPGLIDTARADLVDGPVSSGPGNSELQEALKSIPLGRKGDPAEIAAVATFLASPLASYVTGTTLAVDGGISKNLI